MINRYNIVKIKTLKEKKGGNAMSVVLLDCLKHAVSTSDNCNEDVNVKIRDIFHSAPAFTTDQLVFHCSSMASKSGLTEQEMMAIISNARRHNAE